MLFEDLASSIDAGLGFPDVLSHPGPSICDALAATGTRLSELDRGVLAAGERAGELPRALRERAQSLRAVAELERSILAKLAYPTVLLLAGIALTWFLMSRGLGGSWLPMAVLLVVAASLLGAVLLLRLAHRTAELPAPLRFVRSTLADYASIPYLEALRAQYRAGIPIVEAHDLAANLTPIGETRARLVRVGMLLDESGAGYGDALSQTRALDAETTKLLCAAERTGDLEDALERAIQRRKLTFERRTRAVSRVVGGVVYAAVVYACASQIIGFYAGLYSVR